MFRLIEAAAREKIDVLAIDQSFEGVTRENFKMENQNLWMAGRLAAKLDSDSHAKILVLLGSGHLEDKTQAQWLQSRGWRSKRYVVLTPGLENPFVSMPEFFCISDAEQYEYFTALRGSFLWERRLFFQQSAFDGYIIAQNACDVVRTAGPPIRRSLSSSSQVVFHRADGMSIRAHLETPQVKALSANDARSTEASLWTWTFTSAGW